MCPGHHVSRVGFKLPLVDDTSYEAGTLPTKPPLPDDNNTLIVRKEVLYITMCACHHPANSIIPVLYILNLHSSIPL